MNAYQEEILKAVDNLAAEIARVQHVVEQAFPVNESKPSVDEVVTYDGQPYKLVDRLAQVGDVVVFHEDNGELSDSWTVGKPYDVYEDYKGLYLIDDKGEDLSVYVHFHGRTPETVKVYEPTTWEIIQEKATQDVQHRTINCLHTTPTPNERRAELIERAKQFHAEQRMQHNIHIGIYKNERKVEARCVQPDSSYNIGTAEIEEDAVFNLDIAKAIAVGRALEIDVSEFANAVQPTEWVLGMGLRGTNFKGEHFYYDAITKITNDDEYGTRLWCKNSFATKNAKERVGQNCENPVITDDTNAQY